MFLRLDYNVQNCCFVVLQFRAVVFHFCYFGLSDGPIFHKSFLNFRYLLETCGTFHIFMALIAMKLLQE